MPHETPLFNINSVSETLYQKLLIRNLDNNACARCAPLTEIEKLSRLASKAEDLGTPEALKGVDGYRKRIEELKTASSEAVP